MNEFQFINSIKCSSYKQPSLQKGIGDDAAVFRALSDDIVTAVDTFVAGVHFNENTMPAFAIGYKSLAANISDMAAMGAIPKFYLVSIVIPKTMEQYYIQEVFRGMRSIAIEYDMDLIGGDTVSGKELTISITIIGTVGKGKARYRHQARENDVVFVTGTLGDSAVGLKLLLGELQAKDESYFIKRHQYPVPRVPFATSLQSLPRMVLNDISDGIANELNEIAVASKVDIIIDNDKIPLHPSMQQFSIEDQFKFKYFGGEDFELVGAIPTSDWNIVKNEAKNLGLQICLIGHVYSQQKDIPQVCMKQNGKLKQLLADGYVHLK